MDDLTQNLEEALEQFYGEHTIAHLARIIVKVTEKFGAENLIEELKKLV